MDDLRELLHFSLDIARRAGAVINKHRADHRVRVGYKHDIEMVTAASIAVDAFVHEAIAGAHRHHRLLSQETLKNHSISWNEPVWIVDPIDGSMNFAHGHHQIATSIAFAVDGVVQLGVVHNPVVDETFYAMKGDGAFLNGIRLGVARQTELRSALIGTGFPHDRDAIGPVVERLGRVLSSCMDIRRMGSPALDICWTAMGRLDGFYEGVLAPWDVAASCLIAKEAGAAVDHFSPPPEDLPEDLNGIGIIVSNPQLLPKLAALM